MPSDRPAHRNRLLDDNLCHDNVHCHRQHRHPNGNHVYYGYRLCCRRNGYRWFRYLSLAMHLMQYLVSPSPPPIPSGGPNLLHEGPSPSPTQSPLLVRKGDRYLPHALKNLLQRALSLLRTTPLPHPRDPLQREIPLPLRGPNQTSQVTSLPRLPRLATNQPLLPRHVMTHPSLSLPLFHVQKVVMPPRGGIPSPKPRNRPQLQRPAPPLFPSGHPWAIVSKSHSRGSLVFSELSYLLYKMSD